MYNKILKAMEPHKNTVSFYERMLRTNNFLKTHNLIDKIFEPMPDVPLSIICAVTSKQLEIFEYQINSLAQFDNIFKAWDELIVVCDDTFADTTRTILKISKDRLPQNISFVPIHRDQKGNRPGLNWDIGVSYANNDRLLMLRDVNLFFHPWNMIKYSREADLEHALHNYTTIFGYTFSPASDRWVYLVHPDFAPTPFLFSWICRKEDYKTVGGFDLVFRRGFDQTSDVDFLLRWSMAELNYKIVDDVQTFHPAIPITEEEMKVMEFESSIPRRYFKDKYEDRGLSFLNELEVPYRSDLIMLSVQNALTYPKEARIEFNIDGRYFIPIKDAFTFAKLPHEKFENGAEKI